MSVWTADDIPDLAGKVAMVTGANTGIGYWTALHLARRGAFVVLACRSVVKADDAAGEIRAAVPGARLEVLPLDLADLGSVSAAATRFTDLHSQLDILVNNAGIALLPFARTADGFEAHTGANFLGHFALTSGLLAPLLATPDSRVVHLGSIQHKVGRIDFDDLNFERRRFRKGVAYGQSKLASLLFMAELDRRLRRSGSSTRSIGAHPGVSGTNIATTYRITNLPVLKPLSEWFQASVLHSPEEAAMPSLMAATSPGVGGGSYLGPSERFESKGPPAPAKLSRRAQREPDAVRLWELASDLTGAKFLGLD